MNGHRDRDGRYYRCLDPACDCHEDLADCDVCGQAVLQTWSCWVAGLETYACARCLGEEP